MLCVPSTAKALAPIVLDPPDVHDILTFTNLLNPLHHRNPLYRCVPLIRSYSAVANEREMPK